MGGQVAKGILAIVSSHKMSVRSVESFRARVIVIHLATESLTFDDW